MSTLVRRIRPDDGATYRDVRLQALLDEPSAFGSTHAAEAEQTVADWDALAVERSDGDTDAVFLALRPRDDATQAGRPVGLVGGYREPERSDVVHLVSMWVAPEARGTGVADTLVDEVVGFARNAGCDAVELWVTVGNDRARAFYERRGFVGLDDFQALPSDPCKDEQRMRLKL